MSQTRSRRCADTSSSPSQPPWHDVRAVMHRAKPLALIHFYDAVRLGAHNVSPSNSSDLEKWVQEAKIVWELDETIGIPRSWTNTPETLEKIEMMKVKAMQKKNSLEALRELQA